MGDFQNCLVMYCLAQLLAHTNQQFIHIKIYWLGYLCVLCIAYFLFVVLSLVVIIRATDWLKAKTP